MQERNIYNAYKRGLKKHAHYDIVHIRNELDYNYSYFPIFFKEGKETRDKVNILLQRKIFIAVNTGILLLQIIQCTIIMIKHLPMQVI